MPQKDTKRETNRGEHTREEEKEKRGRGRGGKVNKQKKSKIG